MSRQDLIGRFACRFCRHDQYKHNSIVGCTSPVCRCMATVGEAGPRTDAELDYHIIHLSSWLPGMEKKPKKALNFRSEADRRADTAFLVGCRFGRDDERVKITAAVEGVLGVHERGEVSPPLTPDQLVAAVRLALLHV